MQSWRATSRQARGEIAVEPGFHAAKIQVIIPVLSFDSSYAQIVEAHLYPEVAFQSTAVRLDSLQTSSEGQTKIEWTVTGTLTFHGKSRLLECPVHLTVEKDRMMAQGKFAIKLADFAIDLSSLLGTEVDDQLQMVFDVTALSGQKVASPAKRGSGEEEGPHRGSGGAPQ